MEGRQFAPLFVVAVGTKTLGRDVARFLKDNGVPFRFYNGDSNEEVCYVPRPGCLRAVHGVARLLDLHHRPLARASVYSPPPRRCDGAVEAER